MWAIWKTIWMRNTISATLKFKIALRRKNGTAEVCCFFVCVWARACVHTHKSWYANKSSSIGKSDDQPTDQSYSIFWLEWKRVANDTILFYSLFFSSRFSSSSSSLNFPSAFWKFEIKKPFRFNANRRWFARAHSQWQRITRETFKVDKKIVGNSQTEIRALNITNERNRARDE